MMAIYFLFQIMISPVNNTLADFNLSMQWLRPNLNNIPEEVKSKNQFLLWKYVRFKDNSVKKIPFVKGEDGTPSAKFPKGQFWSFKGIVDVQKYQWSSGYHPGFYLKNNDLSVIDIDNYQSYHPLNMLIERMLSKGCYIEVSPGGNGLHIFYRGNINWSGGRTKCYQSIDIGKTTSDGQPLKTTCEVFGPDDIRYITLTGRKLVNIYDKNDLQDLPSNQDLVDELVDFKNLFFLPLDSIIRSNTIPSNSYNKVFSDAISNESQFIRKEVRQDILNKINHSKYHSKFQMLSSFEKPEIYNSISEADMAFVGLITLFLPQDLQLDEKIEIILQFFVNFRPERIKVQQRNGYLVKTVSKALENAASFKKDRPNISSNKSIHKQEISRSCIFKVCNAMKIFHLGRSIKNMEYVFEREGNSLRATLPNSLNQTDFKYFMQLLFQYIEAKNLLYQKQGMSSIDDYFDINIKVLLQNLGLSSGGKSYKSFLQSLSKLSKVHMEYNKLLDADKQLYCTSAESLLSFRLSYLKQQEQEKIGYRKLKIKMHPVVWDVYHQSQYNYALINKSSYDSLPSEKLQFLYFYFCQNTFPGKNFVTFHIKELLQLWPASSNRSTLNAREKELIFLLELFVQNQSKINDLTIHLVYEEKKVIKVKVKKNKLKPV